jgi:hypothetical protein
MKAGSGMILLFFNLQKGQKLPVHLGRILQVLANRNKRFSFFYPLLYSDSHTILSTIGKKFFFPWKGL